MRLIPIHSIRFQIIAIILIISMVILGAGFFISLVMDINHIKKNLADQATVAGTLVGQSCVSALTFDYPRTAEKNLKSLSTFPGMINAWVYNHEQLFAAYDTTDPDPPGLASSRMQTYQYKDGFLHLSIPIIYQDAKYGMIFLKISPEFRKEIYDRAAIALAVFICLLFLSYLLATFAQKWIAAPILELAGIAEQISEDADYDVRLKPRTQGEIGTLYISFNNMLKAIHQREIERDVAQADLMFKEQVVEFSTAAVVTTDLKGVVTYTNPAFIKLFRYDKAGNIVGKFFHHFLESHEPFERMLASLGRQRDWIHETKAVAMDGAFLFDVIISADTIYDESGAPINYIITVSDISELRKATRVLEKENRFRTGLQAISDRLRGAQKIEDLAHNLLVSLTQHIDFQIGATYIAGENSELRLRGSYAIYNPADFMPGFEPGEGIVGQAALEKKTILVTDIPENYFSIHSGLGRAVPNTILAVPFVYNNQVMGVLEIGSFSSFDTNDFELLERLNETVAIAIYTSLANRRMQDLLETTQSQSKELLSQTEELQAQQEELQQANEELEEQTQALEEQQEEIKKTNRELEKAAWLVDRKARDLEITSRYKSEFMANMSHELRTPLNSILLLSEVLSNNKEKNLSDKQVNFAENIYEAGSDLLTLINSILDLSKIESGKMELSFEQVEFVALKSIICRTFQSFAEKKGLAFSVHIDRGLPPFVITDKQKVEQVLKNLISNALKFTSQGSVMVRIKRPEKGGERLLSSVNAGKTIVFEVADTGIGIPEDKITVVFEAFKQVDGTISRKYGGTGLGLSISKEIARLLGGEITLSSQPGKGSIFTFHLPEAVALPAKVQEEGRLPSLVKSVAAIDAEDLYSPLAGKTEAVSADFQDDRHSFKPDDQTVLIIEDDSDFLKILYDHAHEQGFKVITALDGEDGLHLADFHRPSAIILDLGLPGIDGWTVMERLKKSIRTRQIPVHIISAETIKKKALQMGAVGFLTKPVNIEKLEKVFDKFKLILSRPVGNVLVVENDRSHCQMIRDIIARNGIRVSCTYSGKKAQALLLRNTFDCLILDLDLPDMSGFDLLSIIEKYDRLKAVPVIVYTGNPITPTERTRLEKYARKIIVRSADTPEKLLDEVSIFLHRVETRLSTSARKVLQQLYKKESVFEGKTVLLVDDDMRNIFAIYTVFEEKGLNIHIAKTGVEAIQRLEENPDTDIVLMDIMMPEMDGYQAMREIRKQKRFKKLPIIALTAKAMKGDRAKCIQAGANDYLSKPVDREKLLSMIRVWLY